MPLPDNPLTLNGGCNCGAIRYQIQIPTQSERPLNPLSPADGKLTFPVVLTDHCNDCRKATASILPTWICVPTTMMFCRMKPFSHTAGETSFSSDNDTASWKSASNFFYPGLENDKYWLRFYKSSPNTTRSFCGKCGTNLTYTISPSMGNGWPDIFDVLLATLDRADLDHDWMAPYGHCWVECEVPWISKLTNGMPEMPRHPTFKLNEPIV